MPQYLNQELSFDEVRWATMRKTSYDSRRSFQGAPEKVLLPVGTRLYRMVPIVTGRYFDEIWWMPKSVFEELHSHGGGRLFRNYVAQYLALPSGDFQLCFVEIELVQPVYAWEGLSSALFDRPGGMQQIYLPNLADRGEPRQSSQARLVHTYWLHF
jgi:hypothetical protein